MNMNLVESNQKALLYVHGRQCKPAADDLLALSLAAMQRGIERDHPEQHDVFKALDVRIAYYGKHVNELLTGSGEYYDEQLDLGDRRNALQELCNIDKRKKFGVTTYDRLPGKSAVPELAAGVAAPLLGTLGLSNAMIAKVAPDLAAYWEAESALAANIRAIVREALLSLLEDGREVMLVSHGTGSIVAWDVLWQLSYNDTYAPFRDRKIDTWLTLGSPLGDGNVRRRLLGADKDGRERFPCNIVSWHNVSAEDDWLCHDNTLADDFKPMLQQRQVSAIRDYRIYNLSVRYGKSDPHCSLGYLIHPRVAQILSDWLARN